MIYLNIEQILRGIILNSFKNLDRLSKESHNTLYSWKVVVSVFTFVE
jgi:hypothetical protein